MRKRIETQQSSPPALESEHVQTTGLSWDGEKEEDMADLHAG